MSERNHNYDVNDPEPNESLHEALCAFLLGELDGPAAAKVEAALADSAELRDERDRIEATIGLVRSACGVGGACGDAGGESLSPELLGTIEQAARPAPAPRVWYQATPFRMAAGFAALAGGLIAGQALIADPPSLEDRILHEGVELSRREAFKLAKDFDVEVAQGAVVGELARDQEEEAAGAASIREQQRRRYEGEIQDFLRGKAAASRGVDKERAVWGDEGDEGDEGLLAAFSFGDPADTGKPHIPYGGHIGPSPFDDLGKTSTDSYGSPGGGGSGGAIKLQSEGLDLAGKPVGLSVGGGGYQGPEDSVARGGAAPDRSAGTNAAGAPSARFFLDNIPNDPNVKFQGGLTSEARTQLEQLGYTAEAEGAAAAGEDLRGRRENLFLGATVEAEKSKGAADGTVEDLMRRARTKGTSPATPPPEPSTRGAGGTVWPPDTEGLAWSAHAEKSVAEVTQGLEELASLGYVGGDSDDFYLGFGQARVPAKRELTPAEIDELCRYRVDRILQGCRRHPHEKPSAMFYRFWGDNPFVLATIDNQSTFGVDVDTASYALARRYLTEGHLPQKAQIRTEEFVNYFKPDVAAPLEENFAIHTDLAPSRFGRNEGAGSQRWMMRVVVRGREVSATERKPVNLTFVVDTSGSMKENDRLELVKHALRLLTTQLDVGDSIAIVAFSNEARMVLPMTSMANRGVVEAAIFGMQPNGGTNAEGGLRLGYEVATAALAPGLTHRVVLLSDGVANIGQTDQNRLNTDVKRNRDLGIYLNTIGVGMNNHNDVFLEQLANKGDGLCNYIDSAVEAKRALVDNFTGAIEPIARDVKIQVEFDKTQVYRHRLLGYENRAIADVDFRNDAIDAGEIGSGHQVVALYELEMTGIESSEPMATVRLRWKQPIGVGRDPLEDTATEIAQPVSFASAGSWEGASGGYQRSVLVAQFAEILRRSVHARGDSLDELIAESAKLDATLADPDFTEFVALLQKSRELILRHIPRHDDLTLCIDAIRRNRILHAQYEELRRDEKRAVIDELERQNAQLEARIRELIKGEIRGEVR